MIFQSSVAVYQRGYFWQTQTDVKKGYQRGWKLRWGSKTGAPGSCWCLFSFPIFLDLGAREIPNVEPHPPHFFWQPAPEFMDDQIPADSSWDVRVVVWLWVICAWLDNHFAVETRSFMGSIADFAATYFGRGVPCRFGHSSASAASPVLSRASVFCFHWPAAARLEDMAAKSHTRSLDMWLADISILQHRSSAV